MSTAVYLRSGDNLRDAMPQTVPSPRGNPCEFGDFAADAFDLSLLPASGPLGLGLLGFDTSSSCSSNCSSGGLSWAPGPVSSDCEVPYSPTSVSQLLSLFCDANASPPPMFPALGKDTKDAKDFDEDACLEAAVKTEPLLGSSSSWENQATAFMFSPASSPTYIKQEHGTNQSVPQAHDVQDDACKDDVGDHQLLREVLKDTSFQKKFNLKPFDLGPLGPLPWSMAVPHSAHSALRRSLSGGSQGAVKLEQDSDLQQLDQDAIEPMISLAIQQMRNEIGNTCSMLGIAPDPNQWTPEDVRAWIMWTVRQFSLPSVQLSFFDMEGSVLASLTESELNQRAPQSGSLLFAQLEIWKASCAEDMQMDVEMDVHCSGASRGSSPAPVVPAPVVSAAPAAPSPVLHHLEVPSATPLGAPLGARLMTPSPTPTPCSPHSQFNSSASSADTSDDEDEDLDGASGGAVAAGTSVSSSPSSSRGSHIHLWQFLKELLGTPQVHGSCVRWLDRPGGVFKIEDSVRVARLWGARKNRPAMNYDKLSRSIRQYYKKGIMKKTERSQRLVYQFCHPYSL